MKKIFFITSSIILLLIISILYNINLIDKASKSFDNENYEESNEYYNKVFIKLLLNSNNLLSVAKNKLYIGDKDEALKVYKRIIIDNSKLSNSNLYNEAIRGISRIYCDKHNYELSLEYLKKLKISTKDSYFDTKLFYVEEMLYIAIDYYNNKEFTKSVETLKYLEDNIEVITNKDLKNSIYTNLALNYYELFEYDKSIEYFEKRKLTSTIELEKNMFSKYIYSLEEIGMYDECLKVIDTFSKTFSDYGFNILLQSEKLYVYICLKDYTKAQEISDYLINKEPNNMDHYIGQYVLYKESHGFEYAQNYLKSLKGKFPKDARIYKFIKDN